MENYSELRNNVDLMAGKKQDIVWWEKLQISRVKNKCIENLYCWCYSNTIYDGQVFGFLYLLGDNM